MAPMREGYFAGVGFAVAIDVAIASELTDLLQRLRVQPLSSLEWRRRVIERLCHPRIHAEVQVGHHEDRLLQLLGQRD